MIAPYGSRNEPQSVLRDWQRAAVQIGCLHAADHIERALAVRGLRALGHTVEATWTAFAARQAQRGEVQLWCLQAAHHAGGSGDLAAPAADSPAARMTMA